MKLLFNSNSEIFEIVKNNETKLKDKIYELIENTPTYLSNYHSSFTKSK